MYDQFINLTITSPPYDELRIYGGYEFEFEKIALELYRITKEGGVVVWVIGDSTVNGSEGLTSAKQKIFFAEEAGFKIHDTMIYEKNGPAYPSKDKYYQIFEYMFVLVRGKLKTFNPIKDRLNIWYRQKFSKTRSLGNIMLVPDIAQKMILHINIPQHFQNYWPLITLEVGQMRVIWCTIPCVEVARCQKCASN